MSNLKIVDNGTNYSLLFLDYFDSEKTFSNADHEGGGYSWQTVISFIIDRDYPQLADKINYDSEGSMFVAYGDDKDALIEVQEIINNLVSNQNLLKAIIEEVPEDMWD